MAGADRHHADNPGAAARPGGRHARRAPPTPGWTCATVLDLTGTGYHTSRETVTADAVTEFAAWLGEHRPGKPQPDDAAELIGELAGSWSIGNPPALYHTCSPHRVAETVRRLRDYYTDDFAAELVALLPDWTAWLAARNGTPPELAERCLPYANGVPHPQLDPDDRDGPARIAE